MSEWRTIAPLETGMQPLAQGHQQSAMRSASIVAASVSQSFPLATQAARDAVASSRSVRSVVEIPKRSRSGITTGCSVINVSTVTSQEIGSGYWIIRGVYALHVGRESRVRRVTGPTPVRCTRASS